MRSDAPGQRLFRAWNRAACFVTVETPRPGCKSCVALQIGISRYENGKITPSVEAIVKFAELFDVSVDYLLVEDAPRRPFSQAHDELGTRLADLDKLSDADRAALLHILDGLLANTRIRAALDNAG